jgi:hypothetical protein
MMTTATHAAKTLINETLEKIRRGQNDIRNLSTYALDFLYQFGYIDVNEYRATLTEKGKEARF